MHRFNYGIGKVTEPQILFPVIAVLLLSAVWAMTFGIVKVNHTAASHAAAASSGELLDTYEAQVVRALREIDLTMNLAKFWHEHDRVHGTIPILKEHGLLPTDLLFVVSVADSQGKIVDSTRPLGGENVAEQDYFRSQREVDSFSMGHIRSGETGEAKLRFSRRLNNPDGSFDGIVIVAVEAAYFVSGYETAKLGEHGVLGLLGSDGIFRVRRTGDTVSYGDVGDYVSIVGAQLGANGDPAISTEGGDPVKRWYAARELYGFPLAVIVGLAVDEQLAAAERNKMDYFWRAIAASVLIVALTGLLGRMSWQLAQSRVRERESSLAHARQVEFLAYHDGLTGLPNRSMFSKVLTQSIGESRRGDKTLALAFLDLDRFKQINDSLGHEAGDQLLQEVAVRLRSSVREGDTVARLGGDEFVVLLPELGTDQDAASVAQKILSVVARPFTLIGQEFRVTASLGISKFPQDGLDEQTLTKNADIAMYQAKTEGKNNFQFYSEARTVNTLERLTLESGLRHALARDEFRLMYQAKRDIRSGRISGMEALLRWQHPDLGLIAPLRFLSVAEESGLIVPIGKWVMKTACQQNVAWRKRGLPPLSMAVNLTPRQFLDEHLIDDVTSILGAAGMDANLLELEFTEGLLIQNVEQTLRILAELKALGIRIAIDDFGTGYSSLATLQRFPLDTIKIDRTLIHDITGPAAETQLATAIIAMGKSLSATVVAQGVETRDQAEFLRVHACDELQGFYFERPLPAEESTKLLMTQATEITYIGEKLGAKAS